MVVRGTPGDVVGPQGLAELGVGLGRQHASLRGAHFGAAVCQGRPVCIGGGRPHRVLRPKVLRLQPRGRCGHTAGLPQGLRCTLHLALCAAQVGLRALRFNFNALQLLRRQVASLHAARRTLGQGLGKLSQLLHFADAVLCFQQAKKRRLRSQHLAHAHVLRVGGGGSRVLARLFHAVGALVAALPSPVHAQRLVHTLLGQPVAAAGAVLQVHLAELAGQDRQWRAVCAHHIGLCRGLLLAGQGHL